MSAAADDDLAAECSSSSRGVAVQEVRRCKALSQAAEREEGDALSRVAASGLTRTPAGALTGLRRGDRDVVLLGALGGLGIPVGMVVPAYGYLVVDTTEDGQVGFDGATIVGNLFALWTGEGSPTRQGCTALSSTKGETRINTARGRLICLETSEARTALLKVKSFLDGTVAARAVVWETQP
ncbi:hypothetical protein [Nonomuraea sp. bgisy101]|uniref:hypothetical protein n=1 Tax=Nonomuraea sp. bgisy101 TaxID=3413784 RepID=UPI003D70B4AD